MSVRYVRGEENSYPNSVEVAVACSDPDVFWLSGHVGGRI